MDLWPRLQEAAKTRPHRGSFPTLAVHENVTPATVFFEANDALGEGHSHNTKTICSSRGKKLCLQHSRTFDSFHLLRHRKAWELASQLLLSARQFLARDLGISGEVEHVLLRRRLRIGGGTTNVASSASEPSWVTRHVKPALLVHETGRLPSSFLGGLVGSKNQAKVKKLGFWQAFECKADTLSVAVILTHGHACVGSSNRKHIKVPQRRASP